MKFEEALLQLKEGKRIKRLGSQSALCLIGGKPCMQQINYPFTKVYVMYCDEILEEDWEVVE